MDPKQSATSSSLFKAPVKLELLSSTGTLQAITVSNIDDLDKIVTRYNLGGDAERSAKRQRTDDGVEIPRQSPSNDGAAAGNSHTCPPAEASVASQLLQLKDCNCNIDDTFKIITFGTAEFNIKMTKVDGIWFLVSRKPIESSKLLRFPEMLRSKQLRVLRQCKYVPHMLDVISCTMMRNILRLLCSGDALDEEFGGKPALLKEIGYWASEARIILPSLLQTIHIFDEMGF
jgi:hypothetical protein